MGITQDINRFFLSFTAFLISVPGRVRYPLVSHSSNTPPPSPAFDLESQSPETQSYPEAPVAISQMSRNPENQPLLSDAIAPEMLRPPLQPLHASQTPPPPPSIDLESQLPETQSQSQPSLILNQEISRTPERQPSHFTTINTETEAPQPHSAMEIELLSAPPTQHTPSPVINPQEVNTVISILEWPNIIMGFCFGAAIQIAVQYETTQHSELSIPFYLRSLSILLTFASLFVSQLMRRKFPDISKVLEKVAKFVAAIVFFFIIITPLVPSP